MADMKYRIAVASSDGIVVNNHFGKARAFYIYDVNEESLKLQEVRKLPPVCEMGDHDEKRLSENVERLSDCTHLLASRVGNGARAVLERKGISVYEIPGIIPESIDKLVKYEQVNELFK
ncbi:MAG: dinitrogenase iron-molybdenum cofactor biosynthesis protein [Clostridiales bacterium]|nr:dinitrogenase iron-molybdenum cofactor biosynthesis protein [Clostridiales bacterium]